MGKGSGEGEGDGVRAVRQTLSVIGSGAMRQRRRGGGQEGLFLAGSGVDTVRINDRRGAAV